MSVAQNVSFRNDIYDRLNNIVDSTPGVVFSRFVNDLLEQQLDSHYGNTPQSIPGPSGLRGAPKRKQRNPGRSGRASCLELSGTT